MRSLLLVESFDCKMSSYTTDVTSQRPVNSKRGTVFSVWSLPRCYKQYKLGVSCCFEKLVVMAEGSSGTQRKGNVLYLEAAMKQRLLKTVRDWGDIICPIVI
jgi:ribosomal protein S26